MWVCYWKILITIEKYFDIEKRAIDNQYKPITEKISYWTSININILIDIEKYWKVQYFSIDADPYFLIKYHFSKKIFATCGEWR